MQNLGSHAEQCALIQKERETVEGFDKNIDSVMLKTITIGEQWIINMCSQWVEGMLAEQE